MNFLLINADQLRHDCVGWRGLRDVRTPNLDRLAESGVRYENAFTPLPVCAPARQAILCGRHPDSFGAQWNYDFMETPTVQPEWCWPRDLTERGWQTAYLGRFHVSPTLKPADFGYQKHVSWAGHKQLLAEKYPNISYEGGWLGCPSPVAVNDSGTHWMADRASEVIREFAENGKPWHIWVDYEEPHLPCRPSEPFASMYDPEAVEKWPGYDDTFEGKPYCHKQQTLSWDTADIPWSEMSKMVARYYGVISQLDDAIGRILDTLEQTGQAEDTLVIFTSDHGDMCGNHHMLDKHYVLYDDILRVPMIVRKPGVAPCSNRAFVSNCLDIPHSIREWLGLPASPVAHGRMLPLSEEESFRDDIVCVSNGQQFGLYTTRMLRDDRWKYVWNLTDRDELYDLETDPGELHNRIAEPEQQERIAGMRKRLFHHLVAQGDHFVGSDWIQRQLLEGKKHID